jgi:hypothetical protein
MKKLLFVLIGCFLTTGAFAAETETRGFQLSLVPEVAIHPKTTRINGVSLGIWNENPQSGFALGFVNGASGDSTGLLLGVLGNYAENYTGAQWSYFVNYNKGRMIGFQYAAFNYTDTLKGFQLGFVNYAKSTESGLQIGLFNIINDNEKWFVNFPKELAPGMVFVNWRFM